MKLCGANRVNAVQLMELRVTLTQGTRVEATFAMLDIRRALNVAHGSLPANEVSSESVELLKKLLASLESDIERHISTPMPAETTPAPPPPEEVDDEEGTINASLQSPGSI